MANPEQMEILRRGVGAWNEWRQRLPQRRPDLSNTDLSGETLTGGRFNMADLSGANLSFADAEGANFMSADLEGAQLAQTNLNRTNLILADLRGAYLNHAKLIHADLTRAKLSNASLLNFTDLSNAELSGAELRNARLTNVRAVRANLRGAILSGAVLNSVDLTHANLTNANLSRADLTGVDLRWTNLTGANLYAANLEDALMGGTIFGSNDLSVVKGVDSVRHTEPSCIGVDTLYQSRGKIPKRFLSSCKVPNELITFLPDLITAQEVIQFHSCFISYSSRDEEFARRLHSRFRDERLRVWFAPEDIRGGEKLDEQIEQAIRLHDKLLLVLSNESMQSEWVMTEIRNARRIEGLENRRKLFPISLTRFDEIKKWKCFDADTRKDLATEIREYFIPDFSEWENPANFESNFRRLLRDLRLTERRDSGT